MGRDVKRLAADPQGSRGPAPVYRISVEGQLDLERAAWFEELEITFVEGKTILTGSIPDQPALFGVLGRIRDLGLELVLVERLSRPQTQS